MARLRPIVFWPPFLLLMAALIYSFIDARGFLALMTAANNWIVHTFDGVFAWGVFAMLTSCFVVYASPLGGVRLGGESAQPLLSPWKWFSITLCTTIATGILFWGTAEPVSHLAAPPKSLGLTPGSREAAVFSLSSVFLHWTLSPYAIYTIPAVMFAFAYYNMGKPFSLGSLLTPLIGDRAMGGAGKFIDALCLYALVAGMSASLGAGLLTMSGGLNYLLGLERNGLVLAGIALAVVVVFVASSISGLMRGIRVLSDINAKGFILLILFMLVFGPTLYILTFGGEALWDYARNIVGRSLLMGYDGDDPWPHAWTVFNWANWLAWAPVTALFLGRIGYGYRVRTFILVNLGSTALFGLLWMAVLAGTAIHMEVEQGLGLTAVMKSKGPEAIMYFMLEKFPLARVVIPLFVLMVFLSYVTAADSNTTAMSGISSRGISPDSPEPAMGVKLAWGVTVGVTAWVMVSFAGIKGVKMLSNLGGLPALFLGLATLVALLLVAFRPSKYDRTRE